MRFLLILLVALALIPGVFAADYTFYRCSDNSTLGTSHNITFDQAESNPSVCINATDTQSTNFAVNVSGYTLISPWQSDTAIASGLGGVGITSTSTVFEMGGTEYLISGENDGVFNGFNWTGSTWQSDTAIASGLGDIGFASAPTVFEIEGTEYLIAGENNGVFFGFNWTGSTWQSDTAIASGLGDIGIAPTPTVFEIGGTEYLIAGENNGVFFGFNWTGSTWQSDTAIASGLGDIGTRSAPTVFEIEGTEYLISGEDNGGFFGFNWTGSTWQSDTAIASGLGDIGTRSAPTVFEMGGTEYLIAGENNGVFFGFNWTVVFPTNPTLDIFNEADPLNESYDAPVSRWRFSEGTGTTTADDNETNNNDGTLNGTTWTTDGYCGNALSFDVVNNYVQVSDSTTLDVSFMTIAGWVKFDKIGIPQYIWSRDGGGSDRHFFVTLPANNLLRFDTWDDSNVRDTMQVSGYALSVGQWYYLAFTINSTTKTISINGTVIATRSGTFGTLKTGTEELYFGYSVPAGAGGSFNGTIDEVAIFNRALSADEIEWIYENPCNDWQMTGELNQTNSPQWTSGVPAGTITPGGMKILKFKSATPGILELSGINYGPWITSATPINNIATANASVIINVTATDPDNATLNYYLFWNDTLISAQTNGSFNFTHNGIESIQNWTVNISDEISANITTGTNNIRLGTPPVLEYIPETPANATITTNNWFVVNVSSDDNISEGLLQFDGANSSMTCVNINATFTHCYKNTTGISDDLYTYQVFMNNTANILNKTEERTIIINAVAPPITIFSPENITYNDTNIFLLANSTAVDEDSFLYWINVGGVNITQNISFDGNELVDIKSLIGIARTYSLFVWVNDTGNNANQTSVTFTVNTTNQTNITIEPTTPPSGGGGGYDIDLNFTANLTAAATVDGYEPFTIRVNLFVTDTSITFDTPIIRFSESNVNVGSWNLHYVRGSNNNVTYERSVAMPPGVYSYFIEVEASNGIIYYSTTHFINVRVPSSENISGVILPASAFFELLVTFTDETTPKSHSRVSQSDGIYISGTALNVNGTVSNVTLFILNEAGTSIISTTGLSSANNGNGTWSLFGFSALPENITRITIQLGVIDSSDRAAYSVSRKIIVLTENQEGIIKTSIFPFLNPFGDEGEGGGIAPGRIFAATLIMVVLIGGLYASGAGTMPAVAFGVMVSIEFATFNIIPTWVSILGVVLIGMVMARTALNMWLRR